mmetsp:Transcript_1308/g.1757  ORF Transcript_1308/g.1757 Transcript_1308/m.1757 type:complete len:118 (-) Transcript_1308:240-593(-)
MRPKICRLMMLWMNWMDLAVATCIPKMSNKNNISTININKILKIWMPSYQIWNKRCQEKIINEIHPRYHDGNGNDDDEQQHKIATTTTILDNCYELQLLMEQISIVDRVCAWWWLGD